MECPDCGVINEAARQVGGEESPDAGDISVCFSCAGVNIFTGDGINVRPPTPEEWQELMYDELIMKTQERILALKETK